MLVYGTANILLSETRIEQLVIQLVGQELNIYLLQIAVYPTDFNVQMHNCLFGNKIVQKLHPCVKIADLFHF
jgi:hypothetical protein